MKCPCAKDVPVASIGRKLRRRLGGKHWPIVVFTLVQLSCGFQH